MEETRRGAGMFRYNRFIQRGVASREHGDASDPPMSDIGLDWGPLDWGESIRESQPLITSVIIMSCGFMIKSLFCTLAKS